MRYIPMDQTMTTTKDFRYDRGREANDNILTQIWAADKEAHAALCGISQKASTTEPIDGSI